MAQTLRPAQLGFTLLEMLVVLVIIGMLVSLVGPRLFAQVDSSKVQTAQTQVKLLRGAIETMRLDLGSYPTKEQGLSLLITPPGDEKLAKRWRGPYLEDALPNDPWNNAYEYVVPGPEGRPFGIYSLGADGKPGGEGNDADVGMVPKQATP
ncbi:type II secretion system protein GspG [Chitinimonas arctica]|uniref:Type II secretion system core protein G n=1 Tax=Chitinimonas arctica TaxID=2594795 RepID=A0A516SMD8_9NEIS|nr:type II secretion system protein GspG [Chitinimonas arctica]